VKVSSDQLDRIREATNIVDLVSEHVRLKKRGRNFVGLCPFHNEKTPSFNVLEDRGIFKCFGCGKGGDVFSFVMQLEGLSFPEAIQKLAKRANIEIEGSEAEADEAARGERESVFNALREAAAFYYRSLRLPIGESARDYLISRGLYYEHFEDDEDKEKSVQEKFGIGFAPERSGMLINHLTNKGLDLAKLELVGLIARRDSGEYYERFRGRVIFPVFNQTGRIVGFGGRILPNSSKELAKYINSPDTQVYHKSQILYGLFQAKDAIRHAGFAILVEGYADVLALFQAGIENVVAASGTSLTIQQLKLLDRYTRTEVGNSSFVEPNSQKKIQRYYRSEIVLVFDADTAGKNATNRGIELALQAGFDVNIVTLPIGEDPDSFIRLNGKEAFEMAIQHRQSFIETKAQWFEEHGSFRDPAQLAAAVHSIVQTIAIVPDTIKHGVFINRLSERFHLSQQMLTLELQKLIGKSVNGQNMEGVGFVASKEDESNVEEAELELNDELIHSGVPVSLHEGALLEAMLADPIAVDALIESEEFQLDLISHPHVRELLSYLIQRVEEDDPPNIAQLLDEFRGKPEFETLLTTYGMASAAFSGNWEGHSEEDPSAAIVAKARQAIEELQRGKIVRRQNELSSQVRREGYSDDDLREIIALQGRPEMQKKHVQQIGGEAA
jgi:DNA primase catalytic core